MRPTCEASSHGEGHVGGDRVVRRRGGYKARVKVITLRESLPKAGGFKKTTTTLSVTQSHTWMLKWQDH